MVHGPCRYLTRTEDVEMWVVSRIGTDHVPVAFALCQVKLSRQVILK
jgi:hypothetical protein